MTESVNLSFDELKIGMKKGFSVKITSSKIDEFAKLSGDYNPLHMDNDFALKTKFGQRVCHGMLLASFFSNLIGMHLPGKNSLYFSQSLNFISPCFENDEINVEGEIVDKSISTKMVTIKTSILNQKKDFLVKGQAKVMII